LDESGPNRLLNVAAFSIHSAIHRLRPDVICAAHSHSIHGRAFSTLGIELDMLTQDSCAFYNDQTVYKFNGPAFDTEEGLHIAEALGSKKAAILQNHGLLVAADTIEGAVFFFTCFEKSCKVQLLADAAAAGRGITPIKISDAKAEATCKMIGQNKVGWFSGLPEFQALEAREEQAFELKK